VRIPGNPALPSSNSILSIPVAGRQPAGRNGLDILKEIHRRDPQLSIVLITAYGSIEMARAAFKNGAMDYITKPWSNDELLAQGGSGRRVAPGFATKTSSSNAPSSSASVFPASSARATRCRRSGPRYSGGSFALHHPH